MKPPEPSSSPVADAVPLPASGRVRLKLLTKKDPEALAELRQELAATPIYLGSVDTLNLLAILRTLETHQFEQIGLRNVALLRVVLSQFERVGDAVVVVVGPVGSVNNQDA